MVAFQGIFFLVLGIGLLAVDWQSLSKGWLPCGPNGLKGRREFHRADEPLGYWVMFLLYAAGGVTMIVFALRLFAGHAEPLPLQ